MNGKEILARLPHLSEVETIKDVPQLTHALFPGTHCPLMGAAMAVGGIKDALMVIVGTDECSYYTKTLAMGLENFGGPKGRCCSVVLSQHDVTFGSTEKMHNAFKEIVEEYKPSCVFLVTTCVIEVIGDDYDSIADELSRKYEIPVLAVHTEHFKCEDHFPGLERTVTACFDLMEKTEQGKSVNVLGQRMGNFATTELYKVLKDAGVEIGMQLPSGTTLAEIKKAAQAKVNIVVHELALPLAKKMNESFGTPYVYFNKFVNPDKIMQAYTDLFKFLELPLPKEITGKFMAAKGMEKEIAPSLKGITYIYGNSPFACFEYNAYMAKLGMIPQVIQSNHLPEEAGEDIANILKFVDPYIVKAANIAPLQYVYDECKPYVYVGHEFADRLRKKGIAVLHADPAGRMQGFEAVMFILGNLQKTIEMAKEYKKEATK